MPFTLIFTLEAAKQLHDLEFDEDKKDEKKLKKVRKCLGLIEINPKYPGLNTVLTTTGNTMVGETIAQALRDSIGSSNPNNVGGHLPVFMDVMVPADLVNDKSVLDFGTRMINTSSFLGLTTSNGVDAAVWGTAGVQNLNYSFSVVGSGFLAPSGSFNLLAGQSLESFIQIDTSSTGVRSAFLNVTDNVTGQTRQVTLTGTVLVPEPASMVALGLGIVVLLRRRKK